MSHSHNYEIESLINSVHIEKEKFIKCMEFFTNKYLEIFDNDSFYTNIYDDKEYREYLIDNVTPIELIPRYIRNAWFYIFENPPSLYERFPKKTKLYQLYFNIEDFLNYFKRIYLKTEGNLIEFKYDRLSKHLDIILNDYLSELFKKVSECDNIDTEIRNLILEDLI